MPDRTYWSRLHADAAEHVLDTVKRSSLDLDKQGDGWTDDEIAAFLTGLAERTWQVVDALRAPRA